jgi:hypothetical protein
LKHIPLQWKEGQLLANQWKMSELLKHTEEY